MDNIKCFFNPRSIAIIGASERSDSIGARILGNLQNAYKGKVYLINPFRQTINGQTCYPCVSKAPEFVDLAIIATPAHTVPQIVEECGQLKIPSVVIVSAGFSENSEAGQELIARIMASKKAYGTRIIGPTSFGVIRPSLNLYATFGEKKALPGKIALISQSATLCGLILDWSKENNVGLSAVVSMGSMIDVQLEELIEFLGNDAQTKTIMLYVESIKNVRNFISAARGFARNKPIIVLKAGSSKARKNLLVTEKIQLSEDIIYDALFKRCGIVRVETINELFDCARTLSIQPNPPNPQLTIITNSSGLGTVAADQLTAIGGRLADVSANCIIDLKNILPYYCNLTNPIDILEEATDERFQKTLEVCVKHSDSSFLVIYTPVGLTDPSQVANIVIELTNETQKDLLICLMGEDYTSQEARRILNQRGIPVFKTPEEAVRTFMYMYNYTQNLELLYQTPIEKSAHPPDAQKLRVAIRRAFCEGRNELSIVECLQFLEAYEIPTTKPQVVETLQEALTISSKLGYPVEVKALYSRMNNGASNRYTTGIYSENELTNRFTEIIQKTACDIEQQSKIVIQEKLCQQPAIFFGSARDPKFGSVIIFGTDDNTSKISDFSVGFPPLNNVLAKHLLTNTKLFNNKIEHSDLQDILVGFSRLLIDFPEIIQSKVKLETENSVRVVDCSLIIDLDRVMRPGADHHEHLVIAPYPKKYETKRTIKNGCSVTLQPIKPEDENQFNELFKSLSIESVRFRFFEIIKELSHDKLSRFCNIDYDREIAIVAKLENDDKIVGVVRLILDSTHKSGEFAIMVGDAWQGLGLGSKLMDYIIEIAIDLKIQTIYSYVTPENTKMINLCSKKGFKNNSRDEYSVDMSLTLLYE